jgi:hypothetical protein
MDRSENHSEVPTGWLEALAESEAELATGQTVLGEAVRQRLLDSIARIEAKQAAARQRSAALPRAVDRLHAEGHTSGRCPHAAI